MKTFKQLLIELNACKDAIEWVQDRTIEQAVTECERADWILWLAEKVECDRRKLVLCGGLCANTVRHLMTDERSTKAVDTAIAYGQGNASDEELYAARAVASAAARAAARDAAKDLTGNVKWSLVWDMAYNSALKQMSEIVKPIIGQQLIKKVNNLLQ